MEKGFRGGHEPPDDQRVDQVRAVGQPAQRHEHFPTQEHVDET